MGSAHGLRGLGCPDRTTPAASGLVLDLGASAGDMEKAVDPSVLAKLCDGNGFLRDWQSWTPEVARALADQEGVALTEAHWDIIYLLRDYYQTYDASPANRALVKFVKKHRGDNQGNSIYLLSLFHTSPARVGSRIAGLPKPKNCL